MFRKKSEKKIKIYINTIDIKLAQIDEKIDNIMNRIESLENPRSDPDLIRERPVFKVYTVNLSK